MKKSAKIALAVATLWPFAYMIVFFVFFMSAFMFNPPSPGEGSGMPVFFAVFIALHLFTMLLSMALTVFYMVNVFRNDRVDKDKKVLWAVVLFLGNMIAMPIYWYLYIWKDAPAAAPPLPQALGSADSSAWVNSSTTSARQHEYVPPPEPPNWRE